MSLQRESLKIAKANTTHVEPKKLIQNTFFKKYKQKQKPERSSKYCLSLCYLVKTACS